MKYRKWRMFFLSVVYQLSDCLTIVMFSGGIVGKLGEEKVKPLSVPASNGCRSKVTSSFHCPASHRFRLSTPTNQSGLGITFTIKESCEIECNMIRDTHILADNTAFLLAIYFPA